MIARFYWNWIAQDADNHSLKFILGILSAMILEYHKIEILMGRFNLMFPNDVYRKLPRYAKQNRPTSLPIR